MKVEGEPLWLHGIHPVVWTEAGLTVYALKDGRVSAVLEFFNGASVRDSERESIYACFRMLGETKGIFRNGKRFKKLLEHSQNQVFEFKKNQVRIACIWVGINHKLLLLHGCIKKSDDWKEGEIRKLKNRLEFYIRNWGHLG